jgi:hypothetical protein
MIRDLSGDARFSKVTLLSETPASRKPGRCTVLQQSPISFQMATKNVLIIDGNEAMQNLRASC